MDNNLLEEIRKKEEELEILLQKAKEEAKKIIKDAKIKAEEIKLSIRKEAEVEAEGLRDKESNNIKTEVDRIVMDATERAKEYESIEAGRIEDAVSLILETILPRGSDDSKDE